METTAADLRAREPGRATIINVGKHQGPREIRGAIRYKPHDLLAAAHLSLPIAPDAAVILYDEDGGGDLTAQIAEKLRSQGYADVRTLQGGFKAWEAAGGETQEPTLEQVVPPSRPEEAPQLDRRL